MDHKSIEELTLNHWQALSTVLYDGWLLRFADGYTKRANSINPIHYSTHQLLEKIEFCESLYSANQLPTIFKITPFVHPIDLDSKLTERGYSQVDLTSMQVMKLDALREPTTSSIVITDGATDEWINHFCRFNSMKEAHRSVMERMLSGITFRSRFILFYIGDQAVACGFGVIERECIGLYDIVTEKSYRNKGYGEQMILHLLQWGKLHGAKNSCLAVVANNAPARRLYEKIGFKEIYTYWYRVNQ
ncbi:GNAT family N-acetyltransferase [Paenibacillus sp. HB172176]|uniref:GNAT family N-acetyltransferase n=1 Tax=Paenibacillus sp. HB172176 TaxID=2493690 RepID=UPI00143A5070|nr:GNAT family N-acetyltransferase [Paenibacillus sp. HB172176]